MYKIIANGSEEFIAIKFTEKVTKEDYNSLIPILKEKLEKYKKINLYWELENFEGWDAASFTRELQFDLKYASQFNKVAIVGESQWQKLISLLGNYLTQAQIKFFDKHKQLEAMNWVTSKTLNVNEDVYKNSSLLD